MTTQTIHIQTYDHGASLTSATLRTIDTDTLVATADTVNEVTADSGLYAAVFGEVSVIAAGDYRLRAVVGGQPINRYVTLAGVDAEVVQSRSERYAVLDSAARVKLDATQPDYAPSTQTSMDAIAIVANKIGSVVFGTVTGAGTATEVFVGAGITTTVTVDVDGNRSAVVFT